MRQCWAPRSRLEAREEATVLGNCRGEVGAHLWGGYGKERMKNEIVVLCPDHV